MPKATVTVRELKNKDSGVDLSVTSYRELPGLMRSTYEYQIVVVTNLSCFKLPSHKDTDVVQFTLFKKFNEFEDLRARLNEEFSGTALPMIVKKSIIINDGIIKERRNNLDRFLKFIAAIPRIVQTGHILTFLGVEPQKARRFASGETDESTAPDDDNSGGKEDGEETESGTQGAMGRSASNLFEDEEEEDDGGDDFLTSAAAENDNDDDDFFGEAKPHHAAGTQMFESQDLKRELTEDDEKDFTFIPDAIITKREVVTTTSPDNEDDEDLLNVEEDINLDNLLTPETSSKTEKLASVETTPKTNMQKPEPAQKPSLPNKPKPAPKPTQHKPDKPEKPSLKPSVPVKPKPRTSESEEKPQIPTRPKPAPRKMKPQAQSSPEGDGNSGKSRQEGTDSVPGNKSEDLSTDDIMQYIAVNAASDDMDLDLFS